MPLASMQQYCRGIINGLALPITGTPALTAWVTPPVFERADSPRAYVWGGRVRASRQTAPRGQGMMRFPWTVDNYLVYLDTPDDARENEPFPQVIDAVVRAYLATVMPAWVDASGVPVGPNSTGPGQSQVQSVGESFDIDYPPEKLAAPGRMIWYSARIGVDLLEVVQA